MAKIKKSEVVVNYGLFIESERREVSNLFLLIRLIEDYISLLWYNITTIFYLTFFDYLLKEKNLYPYSFPPIQLFLEGESREV